MTRQQHNTSRLPRPFSIPARWRLALALIKQRPWRMFLVGLAIMVGAMMVAASFGAHSLLTREIARSYAASRPAAVIAWLTPQKPGWRGIDRAMLSAIQKIPGVRSADARRMLRARVEIRRGQWRSLLLYGVRDPSDIRVSKVLREQGQWPRSSGQIILERSGLSVLQSGPGKTISLRVAGQRRLHRLKVVGVAHDPAQAPGWQDNIGYGYVGLAGLTKLGVGGYLDQLHIDIAGDRSEALAVAARVRQWLTRESSGPGAGSWRLLQLEVPVRKHPHAEHMETMLLLLRILSALGLLLAAALVANLVSATMIRQRRQIGIMKVLGGTRTSIAGLYLRWMLLLALPAVLAGVLAGKWIAVQFAAFVSHKLNLAFGSSEISHHVLVVVGWSSLLVPLLTASYFIWKGLQETARSAIHASGLQLPATAPATVGWWPTSLVWMRLSLRNTFRRPGRLWLTLLSLALGGALLLTSLNVYQSLIGVIDHTMAGSGHDLTVRLLTPAPARALRKMVMETKHVKGVAIWGAARVGISASGQRQVAGVPASSPLLGQASLLTPPKGLMPAAASVFQGRWLRLDNAPKATSYSASPSNPQASKPPTTARPAVWDVVFNRQLRERMPTLHVGQELTLSMGARQLKARLVGVTQELAPPSLYALPQAMAALAGRDDVGGALRIKTAPGKAQEVATRLEMALAAKGWFPRLMMTQKTLRKALVDHFAILLFVLLSVALCALAVGALGLATSMGLNVMERSREIGVLRSIGSTRKRIRQIILLEGMVVAGLSLIAGALLSLPMSWAVGYFIGHYGLFVHLPFVCSPLALLLWTVLASAATWVACLWPAAQATSRPARELLAYE